MQLYCYKSSGTENGYCDDLAVTPVKNYVVNGNFESGHTVLWRNGDFSLTSTSSNGNSAALANSSLSGNILFQIVYNLKPNTTYRLTGAIASQTPGTTTALEAKLYNGTAVTSASTTSSTYSKQSTTFNHVNRCDHRSHLLSPRLRKQRRLLRRSQPDPAMNDVDARDIVLILYGPLLRNPAEAVEKTVGAHHPCIRKAFTTPPLVTESATAPSAAELPVEEMPFVPPGGTQGDWWPTPPSGTRRCRSCPRATTWPRSATSCGSSVRRFTRAQS